MDDLGNVDCSCILCWRSKILNKTFHVHKDDLMLIMMMMNFLCEIDDRRKALSLISSRDFCQIFLPSDVSGTPRAGFEPAPKLSSYFVEGSCAVVIATTPWRMPQVLLLSMQIAFGCHINNIAITLCSYWYIFTLLIMITMFVMISSWFLLAYANFYYQREIKLN